MNTYKWLAIETSTDILSLAIASTQGDKSQVWAHTSQGGAKSSQMVLPEIVRLMDEAQMRFADLTAVVFGKGPGSFTGLRTACSVAQGLAFGAGVPVLPIDTLLAVAEEARWSQLQAGAIAHDAPRTVLALLDARMDEVYSAAYRWEHVPGASLGRWQEAAPLQVGAPEKLQMPDGPMVLQAGNAFAAYGERLPQVVSEGWRCEALPTAAALLRLAPALWAQGLAVPAEQAMPLYIRDKVAQTTAERAQATMST